MQESRVFISIGGSSVAAVEALQNAGGVLTDCLAIFSTLIRIAGEDKYINAGAVEKVLEWSKDPVDWGKKMGFE